MKSYLSLSILKNEKVERLEKLNFFNDFNCSMNEKERHEYYSLIKEIFGCNLFSKKFKTYKNLNYLKEFFVTELGEEMVEGIIKVNIKDLKKIKEISSEDKLYNRLFQYNDNELYSQLKKLSKELNNKKIWKKLKKNKNNIYVVYC